MRSEQNTNSSSKNRGRGRNRIETGSKNRGKELPRASMNHQEHDSFFSHSNSKKEGQNINRNFTSRTETEVQGKGNERMIAKFSGFLA